MLSYHTVYSNKRAARLSRLLNLIRCGVWLLATHGTDSLSCAEMAPRVRPILHSRTHETSARMMIAARCNLVLSGRRVGQLCMVEFVKRTGILLIKVRLVLVVIFASDCQHVQGSGQFVSISAALRAEKGRTIAGSLATHLVKVADVIHVENRTINFFDSVSWQS